MQGGLFRGLKPSVPRLEDHGVKEAPFVVLIATEMPGILAEISTVSNDDEARRSEGHPATARRSRAPSRTGSSRTRSPATIPPRNGVDMTAKKDVLHVGIDLGTSRSAIAASNGTKHVVDSYVGWPLDMVARKIVKKTILFGAEALEARSMLDLHRPLERGLIKQGSAKDEEAVHELLKHLITLAGRQEGQRVEAVVGVPAEALRVSRQHLRGAVKGIADALLIVSEPFAVAYGMDALLHTMVIDIGAGTTDFCVMNGRYPTEDDQRTLTHAGDSIDDQLMKLVKTKAPDGRFSIHMVREWKEKHSFVGDAKQPVSCASP